MFGCTGAVGSQILGTLIGSDAFTSVKTVSRRLPKLQSAKLEAVVEADTSKWGSMMAKLDPKPTAVFNAVGTTRAAAGGLQEQWKIDHDLCVENAKAAKAAGASTYVFVSSAGTRGLLSIHVPYSKMKVGVEDAVKALDFDHAIVLRPGMIIGDRETPKSPFLESLIGNLHRISPSLQDMIGTCVDSLCVAIPNYRHCAFCTCSVRQHPIQSLLPAADVERERKLKPRPSSRSRPDDHRESCGGGRAARAPGEGAV